MTSSVPDVPFTAGEEEFVSRGTTCRGDLYLPDLDAPTAGIVMSHGFGASRVCGLAPFAEAFASAGFIVFVIDYRSFGTSDGEPRRNVHPARQVADVRAAADHLRTRSDVNGEIALWGTSFGGGVATVAASLDPAIRAVVAQCPMMDGLAAARAAARNSGIVTALRLTGLALTDLASALLHRPPRRVPSAGSPRSVAAMNAPDCADGYAALVPDGVETDVTARVLLRIPAFRPVRTASRVRCPALVQICETDTVAPVAAAERAAARMSAATVRRYPCGHFDVYRGDHRAASVADQLAFLREHLDVPTAPTRRTT